MPSFGAKIAEARKAAGLSQKELAGTVEISPQYLNDIEHGKRNPSSEELIEAFAKALSLDAAVLYYLAGRLPSADVRGGVPDDKIVQAYKVFRRTLKK
jgi:transcriptional regulator with XRE-family HTH domain